MNHIIEIRNKVEFNRKDSTDNTTPGSASLAITEFQSSTESNSPISLVRAENFYKYSLALPHNLDILTNLHNLDEIKNDSLRKQIERFLIRFRIILYSMKDDFNDVGNLPPLMLVTNQEDQSILIEWIFRDFRIGFSFEIDEMDLSWYFVSNNKFQSYNTSSPIKIKEIDNIIIGILNFVISHI